MQIGEHPPDDADRPALADDEIEQPQHLVEHQQHRREHQRAEQRHEDQPREIAVDLGREIHLPLFCCAPIGRV